MNLIENKMMVIIGHVTDKTANIFVGYKTSEQDLYGTCHILDTNECLVQTLKKYNNNTTTFHITNLNPESVYTLQISISDKAEFNKNCSKIISFVTMPNSTSTDQITIGLCSCQYPIPYKSDKIFKAFTHVLSTTETNNHPVVFHVGDQIYADQLNRLISIKRADTAKEFVELYENKYMGKYFSNFSSRFSSLMTLDDHEIEDNWSMDRLNDKRDLFSVALTAYKTYQASHSPIFTGNKVDYDNSRLFYTYNIGIYKFFVLDTRTERCNKTSSLISDYQFNCLTDFLMDCKKISATGPKFIVSSVIFSPFETNVLTDKGFKKTGLASGSDNWNGYKTRDKLLEFIVNNDIKNVVFLSGDVHNSMAVKMTLSKKKENDINLYQIISSPLYWPFPFANGNIGNYVMNSTDIVINKGGFGCLGGKEKLKKIKINKWKLDYICYPQSYTQLNNFAILKINEKEVDIKWYGVAGDVLAEHVITL